MTYDKRCYQLAVLFLQDRKRIKPTDADGLASAIQQAIEDWCEEHPETEAKK